MKIIGVEEHMREEHVDVVDQRLRDMDAAGIDMQVLNFVFPYDGGIRAAEAVSRTRELNELLASVVAKYPDRFAAFATLALNDPEAAAAELERAVKQLGMKGAMLFANGDEDAVYLDEKEFWIIYDKAAELGVPLYLHPGPPSPAMIEPYKKYPILLGAVWGYAAENGLQAMRLICSGVFDQIPGLKIILGHLGEGIPYWLWRIDNQWVKGLEFTELALIPVKLRKKPSEYFKENFYVTTSGMFSTEPLQLVISVLGADKVLFAVDYPPESAMEAADFIRSVPISNEDREKICHLNTEKLLAL